LDDDRDLVPDWLRRELQLRVESEIGLPVLPDTACRVMAACQDEHSDLHELAELVTHDQSLATHVLRVANSIAFAPKAPILSLRQALSRLGLSTVSDIAIAVALKQRVFSVPGYEGRIRDLWRHSTATACYAQDVALLLGKNRDTAFLCGLLHDVGMPITMQAVCDVLRGRGTATIAPGAMEAAMREFHCEFGVRIAQRWRLGSQVCSAIYYHHDPVGATQQQEDVLVVTLADELAYWAWDESKSEEDFTLESRRGSEGFSEQGLHTLLRSRKRIQELSRAFQ
jgi:putative nucleotidyltransferase with HDIG domain